MGSEGGGEEMPVNLSVYSICVARGQEGAEAWGRVGGSWKRFMGKGGPR